MDHVRTRFWQVPERLSPWRAGLYAGLALAALVLATLVGGESEGPSRLLSVAVLVLAGLVNLAWALGSLLPEAAGGRSLREVARLLILLLLLTSIAFLIWILYAAIVYGKGVPAIVGGLVVLVVYLVGRLRRQSHNGAH